MMNGMRHSRRDADGDGALGTIGIGSEAPAWEPEPLELPLVLPEPRAPRRDDADASDDEPRSRVIVIDLT